MIQSLRIQNIVLIEELFIAFHPGMQVLTGETGAGKSIVVDAVNLILGGRADRGLIRSGCEKASVEAVFDVPDNKEIEAILTREGIEYDGRTVILWREITAGGRNLCRVCGVVVPAALLKELGTRLMDIHGQHEHQFLMDPEMHLRFLDRTGGEEDAALRASVAAACESFLEAHRRYARLRKENERKQRRTEELEAGLKELHAARLKPGEEESLREECLRLRNSEKIISGLRTARDALTGSEEGDSTIGRVQQASGSLNGLTGWGEKLKGLAERCEGARYELEEIAFELSGIIEESDADPQRLEKAEERLDLIRRLERKYGTDLPAVLEAQHRMEEEYQQLCGLEDEIEETAKLHKRRLAEYRQEARRLTEARKALASRFEERMKEQLADLGMEKTVFQVSFREPEGEKKPMPRPQGDDQIEFLISPNPGEPPRPLARTASGGELSRMMLALKTLESENSGVDCMVFDEIDTGISGRMAQVVAEKMRMIARKKQVICVTHLPQIAAAADAQFHVSKAERDGRTYTSAEELDREGRIREVARMISGAEGSGEDAAVYARSMIEASEKKKGRNRAGTP